MAERCRNGGRFNTSSPVDISCHSAGTAAGKRLSLASTDIGPRCKILPAHMVPPAAIKTARKAAEQG